MASAVIAGLASLGYTMAYIGRWEWQRAQLAADLTLLCAILVLGLVIDKRTRNLPGRRDTKPPTDTRPAPADLPEPPPAASHPFPAATGAQVTPLRPPTAKRPRPAVSPGAFAWLNAPTDPRTERYGVFIPILLGAGMAASGMAWVLERVSGMFSGRAANGGSRNRGRGGKTARLRPDLPDTLLVPADTRLADVLVGYDTQDPAELWLRGPIVAADPAGATPATRDRAEEKRP
ncbi:hypothetical protein LO772_00775 [Yinghuangia sp. ASG 101]|uniref:hypothetical protein n=1 Tax=Yinghuangia sp. ASG 101 TaxID=2896848 RepID=UPI001E37E29B|nr:hypothetical protein [Yinghuangia sp. ASG 101]UGQ12178.1 hypothetical protein LO772_00775 [Yinghuangia sp. ASG 101]